MKHILFPAIIFFLLTAILPVFAQDTEATVSIYSDYDVTRYGRSLERASVISRKVTEFGSGTVLMAPGGYLTAVTVSRDTKAEIDRLLGPTLFFRSGTGILQSSTQSGRLVYRYSDAETAMDFSFTLERVPVALFELINEAYIADPATAAQVTDHYRESYAVRIISGKAVDTIDGSLTFKDALFLATLIGDPFQWLMGLHDGTGFLEDLLRKAGR